jgi:hypothetical protein
VKTLGGVLFVAEKNEVRRRNEREGENGSLSSHKLNFTN